MDKLRLRSFVREQFKNVSKSEYEKRSSEISSNLYSLLDQLNFCHKVIGGFVPLDDEPVWNKGLEDSYSNLSFPFDLEDGKMVFKRARFDQLIDQKSFGIKISTPPQDAEDLIPKVLLIPGMAFGQKGERLGRGRGYFDRYLENFKGVKIGISFDQFVFESVPCEPHDKCMDYLVTETKILKFD